MSPADPRREQQMENQIQQDLGNGLFWFYFVAADFLTFMGTLISALQRSPGWQWFLLAFIISVIATYEWSRHRSRKVQQATQSPAPLTLPAPDPNWRRRALIQFLFLTVLVLFKVFVPYESWKLALLVMLPIAFAIRWKLQSIIERNKQIRIDQITAWDSAHAPANESTKPTR